MMDPFVFVICVRNPEDSLVNEYQVIEGLLERTVASLFNQTYSNVHIVVVCHRTPAWASKYSERLHILNVSGNTVFIPNPPKTIDKALRWIIGSLFSMNQLCARYLMLMDADDYVNINLAQYFIDKDATEDDVDFYLVANGVHTTLEVSPDHQVSYRRAYIVEQFDQTCGSCRIFKAAALKKHLQKIHANLLDTFSHWNTPNGLRTTAIPADKIEWLNDVSRNMQGEDGLLMTLGKHVLQEKAFRYLQIPMLGSAKGCGHGNHQGIRKGEAHWHGMIKRIPMNKFLPLFGLDQGAKAHYFAGITDDAHYLSAYLRRVNDYLGKRIRRTVS